MKFAMGRVAVAFAVALGLAVQPAFGLATQSAPGQAAQPAPGQAAQPAPGQAAQSAPALASPRIVNGVETGEYPTVGALLYAPDGGPVTQHNAIVRCSGILIGCRTFLTAAHCVSAQGATNKFAVYLQHAGFLPVAEVHRHPDYDGSPEHDLAIVKLAEPVEGIEPSAINSSHDFESIGTGLGGTIVGFGRIGGDYYDYEYKYGTKRSARIRSASCDPDRPGGLGDNEFICWDFLDQVGPPEEDSSPCHGDSGGPLFLDFAGSVELAGVTRGGTGYDCFAPSQSIAVRVYPHAAWIAQQLQDDSTTTCGEDPPIGTPLTPVHTESGWLGESHRARTFRVPLRSDTSRVLVTFNGSDDGQFDADLFVKRNADASTTNFDCAALGRSLVGACELQAPGEGFLSMLVIARRHAGHFQLTVVEHNKEVAACGNAALELGEECDGSQLGACPTGPCRQDCKCPDPVCGNGILEDGERCDDGNATPGDGCGASCVPETPDHCEDAPLLELSPGSWTFRGDTTGLGNDYVGCGSKAGDAWYRFSIDTPVLMSFDTDGVFDSTVSIYRGDCNGYFYMWCDSDAGADAGSAISDMPLDAGSYILIVDGGTGLREGPFELSLLLASPGCGNGIHETYEDCDGFDLGYCDAGPCEPDCTCPAPVCGNDIRESNESCDGSDLGFCAAGPCDPDCTCPAPVCGNDIREFDEGCDGSDLGSCEADLCRPDCTCDHGICGNEVRDGTESCDGSDLGFCQTGPCEDCNCPDPICGNGVLEDHEDCDGAVLGDCREGSCADDCYCPAPVCGNGLQQYPEKCDGAELGSCPVGPCRNDCECPVPVCGNDVNEYPEECDGEDARYCRDGLCGDDCKCPAPICGDGIHDYREPCDGPGLDSCFVGACQEDCTCPATVCGNGILEYLEQCDGPNLNRCNHGPCQANCECPPPVCGDGLIEGYEDCDGDADNYCDAGCDEQCQCAPYCGDEVRNGEEECDGNDKEQCASGYCDNDCTCQRAHCGDTNVEGDEQCDGRNLGECPVGPCRDNCRCATPVCENGVLEARESCEDSEPGVCGSHPCHGDCSCDGGLACLSATQLPALLDNFEDHSTTIGAASDSVGCGGDAGERWYKLHVEHHSVLEASTDGAYDSYVSLFAGDCGSLGFMACNDDSFDTLGSLGSRIGPIKLRPGEYLLLVDGHASDEGNFTLKVDLEPWACSDADEDGTVSASDALRVLRRGVGLEEACPAVRCDTDGDGSILASDALLALKTAVGVVVDLYCPSGL